MRKILPWALVVAMAAAPAANRAQSGDAVAQKNSDQARAALNAMVQALGGNLWLNVNNVETEGHIAAFFQGNPDLGTTQYYYYHQWPDHDRIEITKHRDDVLFFIGQEGWEVTYRGKKALPKDQVTDFLLRRDHSIETVVKVWLKDPRTILTYEGPHLVERHLGVQVTAISAENQAVTIVMDTDTHLPLRAEFQSRDPVYHDEDTYAEEYDDYHVVQGFPTAFRITRIKNGDVVQQRYIDRATYNVNLPADFWDPNAAARRIKR
jgi:hypothetical protein